MIGVLVESLLKVGHIERHGLLAHRRLIGIYEETDCGLEEEWSWPCDPGSSADGSRNACAEW
jgi:hypothetical protein